jgi:hypothetical protein
MGGLEEMGDEADASIRLVVGLGLGMGVGVKVGRTSPCERTGVEVGVAVGGTGVFVGARVAVEVGVLKRTIL